MITRDKFETGRYYKNPHIDNQTDIYDYRHDFWRKSRKSDVWILSVGETWSSFVKKLVELPMTFIKDLDGKEFYIEVLQAKCHHDDIVIVEGIKLESI